MSTPRVEFRKRAFDSAVNVAAAKALLGEGLNDGEVALRIGASRSAVAKMRKREGIATRYRPVMEAKASRDSRKAAAGVRRAQAPRAALPEDTRPQKQSAWDALAGTKPVTLVDLEPGMCKWPIGDDRPYMFCGAPAGERSYCHAHHDVSVGRGTESERAAHRARERAPA